MSTESLATRARPAALSRSSLTMLSRRFSVSPAPPMFVIMPDAISWISAMACFMRMSLMAPLRLSILARAVCTATSRAFTRFL